MTFFVDHFKKSWFFFYLLTLRAIRLSTNSVLGLIYELLSLVFRLLTHLFRLLVWVFVQFYMAKRYLLDRKKKHRNPLSKPDALQKSLHVHSIHKRRDVICLALDKTLVSLQTKPPPKDQLSYPIQVTQINGKTVKYYVTPRPFLKDFLDVVSSAVRPPLQGDCLHPNRRKRGRGNRPENQLQRRHRRHLRAK